MANYVKFMRGTPIAFAALGTKDANTLYFISEANSDIGRLYLGDVEIICENNQQMTQYLSDLLDVSLPANVSELLDGQVLTYDVASNKWMAKNPEQVAQVVFDVKQFETDGIGQLSLLDFADAPNGSQLTKSAEGILTWVLPDVNTIEGLGTAVETLRSDVDNLVIKFDNYDTSTEVDTKIATAVAELNHLTYEVVASIDKIDLSKTNVVYLVANGDTYDEYMVVNGELEKIGNWNIDLSNYATKTEVQQIDGRVTVLEGAVGTNGTLTAKITALETSLEGLDTVVRSLQNTVNSHTTAIEILQEDISTLKTMAVWNELSE